MYNKKVLDYFRHPKNYGVIKNYSGRGKVGNPRCGDIMELHIKIGKDKRGREIIKDVKWQTFGCAAAIATSSMVTEMVKGKTLEEAKKISNQQVTKKLGGLPPIKTHCSILAEEALDSAIKDYEKRKKK
ncbi:iron-sulfur cluster assembly scaffold protein [archaeon]|nr:iron-sulfur cluster assembly scaffold protein [archaeon]